MIYTDKYLKDKVLIIRNEKDLTKILNDFSFKDKGKLSKFPMIVYKNRFSIDISEIEENNLNKLKKDKKFSKQIIELNWGALNDLPINRQQNKIQHNNSK